MFLLVECWAPGRFEDLNLNGRVLKENEYRIKVLDNEGVDTYFDNSKEWEKTLVGNVKLPKDCQLKCQETRGCYYFGVELNEVGKCTLYNQWAIKPLIEMKYDSRYYWKNLRLEYSSDVVTMMGPRTCPNKKGDNTL